MVRRVVVRVVVSIGVLVMVGGRVMDGGVVEMVFARDVREGVVVESDVRVVDTDARVPRGSWTKRRTGIVVYCVELDI